MVGYWSAFVSSTIETAGDLLGDLAPAFAFLGGIALAERLITAFRRTMH